MDSHDDILDHLRHLHWLAKDLRIELMLRRLRRKYSPDQPRVPIGTPGGGQWTSGGVRLAQGHEWGTLLGQSMVHPSRGGGKECFYKFSYGIFAVPWATNFACSPTLPWFAVTHGRRVD